MPSFALEPVDESFFGTAPTQLRGVFEIDRPAASVWGDLVSDEALSWCRIITSVKWTSPRPFGVGTTRTARVLGGIALQERYFVWEEGRRHAFYGERATLPMFRSLAEDYLVEPVTDSSCRFTWSIAIAARGEKLAAPANRLLLGTLFADTRRHYGAR